MSEGLQSRWADALRSSVPLQRTVSSALDSTASLCGDVAVRHGSPEHKNSARSPPRTSSKPTCSALLRVFSFFFGTGLTLQKQLCTLFKLAQPDGTHSPSCKLSVGWSRRRALTRCTLFGAHPSCSCPTPPSPLSRREQVTTQRRLAHRERRVLTQPRKEVTSTDHATMLISAVQTTLAGLLLSGFAASFQQSGGTPCTGLGPCSCEEGPCSPEFSIRSDCCEDADAYL